MNTEMVTTKLVAGKSDFIAFAEPIKNMKEAQSFVTKIESKYPKADHAAYGYSFDVNGKQITRASDSKEPKGSAGRAILQTLQAEQMPNTAIIVIRFFSGIFLGYKNLFNTYKQVSTEVLEKLKEQKHA
ncbi:YigZ family protein [Fructilactobacillus sp. Tb1]|uniref:YigZ family protein n=1 Tax=Fructilactobacillus sp. Tb1 TaxID=3422304 RepID=UPI003D2A6B5B